MIKGTCAFRIVLATVELVLEFKSGRHVTLALPSAGCPTPAPTCHHTVSYGLPDAHYLPRSILNTEAILFLHRVPRLRANRSTPAVFYKHKCGNVFRDERVRPFHSISRDHDRDMSRDWHAKLTISSEEVGKKSPFR